MIVKKYAIKAIHNANKNKTTQQLIMTINYKKVKLIT